MSIYCADFETTSQLNLEIDGRVRVWLWSLVECETFNEYYGFTLESFIEKILELNCEKIFFHNLRFDGYFILYWLVENNYMYGVDYTVIIDKMNTWYQMELINGCRTIKIWDSLKKFPGLSVKAIAKMYNYPDKKEYPDFDKYRPLDYIPTETEIEYCLHDSRIIAYAITQELKQGHTAMTLSGDAFNNVKQFIGGWKRWRNNFPVLEPEVDKCIRLSYKGGWVYCNPLYQNQELHNTTSYDVNSLYPWVMHDCLLPYGIPLFRRPYGGEQYVITFETEFYLRDGYLPTVQVKNDPRYSQREYLKESRGITKLAMTNIDYEMFCKHYEIDYMSDPDYISFTSKVGLLAKYIDYWTDVKIQAKHDNDASLYYLSKRWLNSPYGKTGMRPDRLNKIPIGVDKSIQFEVIDDISQGIYVPYATFVCAQARHKTITSAQKNYDNFIYADTDSIHLTEEAKGIEVDDYKLGYWKQEGIYPVAKYIRPKTYIHANVDYSVMEIKCAGMPDSIKRVCNYNDFKIGAKWESGKLMQCHVPGGCILKDTGFSIKE